METPSPHTVILDLDREVHGAQPAPIASPCTCPGRCLAQPSPEPRFPAAARRPPHQPPGPASPASPFPASAARPPPAPQPRSSFTTTAKSATGPESRMGPAPDGTQRQKNLRKTGPRHRLSGHRGPERLACRRARPATARHHSRASEPGPYRGPQRRSRASTSRCSTRIPKQSTARWRPAGRASPGRVHGAVVAARGRATVLRPLAPTLRSSASVRSAPNVSTVIS